MSPEYDPQYMLQTVNGLLGINTVEENKDILIPDNFNLSVYPNPFNPVTNILFTVLQNQPVYLQVVNLLGQVVYEESYHELIVGSEIKILLNMTSYPSGLYFLKLANGNSSASQKIILLK